MHIVEIFNKRKTTFSFEFYPPKTPKASGLLFNAMEDLMPYKPGYVSVTYGAGGSTRKLTHDLVVRIQKETDLTVVSHLTCVGSSKDEIGTILQNYSESGIENIMALRGDPPKGETNFIAPKNGFKYAHELVSFIRCNFPEMGIGVAGFPEGHFDTPNRLKEIEYLKQKVDSGADYICTQLFFDNDVFYDFCERCELAGINVPIIPGIMPVTSRKNMSRIADLALGTNLPAMLLKAMKRAEDDQYAANVGIQWATGQILDLLDNEVKGVHLYTLNRSKAVKEIFNSLGVTNFERLSRE